MLFSARSKQKVSELFKDASVWTLKGDGGRFVPNIKILNYPLSIGGGVIVDSGEGHQRGLQMALQYW